MALPLIVVNKTTNSSKARKEVGIHSVKAEGCISPPKSSASGPIGEQNRVGGPRSGFHPDKSRKLVEISRGTKKVPYSLSTVSLIQSFTVVKECTL